MHKNQALSQSLILFDNANLQCYYNSHRLGNELKFGGNAMSSIIYVVPWAICDTESMYIKKIDNDGSVVLEKGTPVDDWCIRDVINNPDRRSKDIYAVVDVYNGYNFNEPGKAVSLLNITNSVNRLKEYGYRKADEKELAFLRQKILKLDKPEKRKTANHK